MNNKTIFKWFSMLLLMMVAGISGAAAQSLALDDFSIKAGETKDVTIKLVAESAIYGVQTDINLDGLTLEAVAAVNENLSFASNTVEGGAKRVSLLSMSEGTREIPAGDIITLTVKAADSFTNGTISLTNTRLTTTTTGTEVKVDDFTANVTLEEPQLVISSMQLYGTFPGLSWESGVEMANDASNSAIWTCTMTGVEIEGKTYEYKVSANGKWGEYQIPADDTNQNWTFGTDMYPAGIYTLTFTVNTEEHNLTLDPVKTGEIGPAVGEDEAVKEAPTGWTLAITNGNLAGDDVTSYVAKEYPSTDILPATIVAGAGKNGSRGIVVKTADETGNEGAQAWDSQFWIKLNEALPAGTIVHVEFDYKASQAAKVSTQSHGVPGNYAHWAALGDINFTTEWNSFSKDFEVTSDMASKDGGLLSIAFNLAEEKTAIEYYFDNFGV